VDSAVKKSTDTSMDYTDKSIKENNNKENIYYSPSIDDHCITIMKDNTSGNGKSTELYINKNYTIDSTNDNYFKFKTNFKWSAIDNSLGDFYFCIRDKSGLKGYIYLNLKDKTIKTKARSTGLNLNSILPQNEWIKLSIFGKFGGMSYLKINNNIYELDNASDLTNVAFPVPNINDIIYFTLSAGGNFQGSASLSEAGYALGTDEKIGTDEYKVETINISNYIPNSAVPTDKTKPISSSSTNYIWTTMIRDDNDNVVVNKKFVMDTVNKINKTSPLAGKKIAYHGDSICESRTNASKANYNGGGYAKIIADMTGSTYDNKAGSGSVLVSAVPNGQSLSNTAKCIVTDMDNMPDDADIICF
jgi:hypothetical protein